jgi:enamine deaminase RidA (YjgF/YER057c/UK114 family)
VINTAKAPQPIGLYAQALRAQPRELLFIAGQVAVDADGNLVGEGDVAAQTRQIFRNIGTILESVNATFSNVLEFTTYVVGRDAIQPFIQTRRDLFATLYPEHDYPPNTLLVVAGLVREYYLLEIKAVVGLS